MEGIDLSELEEARRRLATMHDRIANASWQAPVPQSEVRAAVDDSAEAADSFARYYTRRAEEVAR